MANLIVVRAFLELDAARRQEARAESEAIYFHNPTHRALAFLRRVQAEKAFKAAEEWAG